MFDVLSSYGSLLRHDVITSKGELVVCCWVTAFQLVCQWRLCENAKYGSIMFNPWIRNSTNSIGMPLDRDWLQDRQLVHLQRESERSPCPWRILLRWLTTCLWFLMFTYVLNLSCLWFGYGSKPWYLVNIKIAGKWMFIPLKMYL